MDHQDLQGNGRRGSQSPSHEALESGNYNLLPFSSHSYYKFPSNLPTPPPPPFHRHQNLPPHCYHVLLLLFSPTPNNKIHKTKNLSQVLTYHNNTKHHFTRYARGPHGLDWANEPNPFRSSPPPHHLSPLPSLLLPLHLPPFSISSLSQLLYNSLALSAWKSTAFSTWSLRVNPSSGNLHPTEAYIISPPIPSLADSTFVAHYAPKEHAWSSVRKYRLLQVSRFRKTRSYRAVVGFLAEGLEVRGAGFSVL